MRYLTVVAIGIALAGCAATSTKQVIVNGAGDAFETNVQVRTNDYTIEKGKTVHFFRAWVDKETKGTTYQLYVQTQSGQWMFWKSARLLVEGDLQFSEATNIGSDVKCSGYNCTHTEHVGFTLNDEQIKSLANSVSTVRISGKVSGADRDIEIDPEEVQAFLSEIERHNS